MNPFETAPRSRDSGRIRPQRQVLVSPQSARHRSPSNPSLLTPRNPHSSLYCWTFDQFPSSAVRPSLRGHELRTFHPQNRATLSAQTREACLFPFSTNPPPPNTFDPRSHLHDVPRTALRPLYSRRRRWRRWCLQPAKWKPENGRIASGQYFPSSRNPSAPERHRIVRPSHRQGVVDGARSDDQLPEGGGGFIRK